MGTDLNTVDRVQVIRGVKTRNTSARRSPRWRSGRNAVWVVGDVGERRLWRVDCLETPRRDDHPAVGLPGRGRRGDGWRVWVTDQLSNRLYEIDPATCRVWTDHGRTGTDGSGGRSGGRVGLQCDRRDGLRYDPTSGRSRPSRSVEAPRVWPWVRARCGWRVETNPARAGVAALTCLWWRSMRAVVPDAFGGCGPDRSRHRLQQPRSELIRAGVELPLLAARCKAPRCTSVRRRHRRRDRRKRRSSFCSNVSSREFPPAHCSHWPVLWSVVTLTSCWDRPASTTDSPSESTHGTTPRSRSCSPATSSLRR